MHILRRPRFSESDTLLRFSLLAVIAAYAQTIRFGFVYDDFGLITLNPWLQSWSGLKLIFTQHSSAYLDIYMPARHYRPIYLAWLWMVQNVLGPAPGWFHLAAVLTHVTAVLLAYQLAKVLLQDENGAAIAALFFAVHPCKVESVAWISGASEAVQAVLVFATLLAYVRARTVFGPRWPWLVLSASCFAAALLTKETSLVVPFIVIAYEVWIAGNQEARAARRFLPVAVFVAVVAAYIVLRTAVLHGAGDTAIPRSFARVLFTAPLAFWLFVRQIVFPYRLSAFYPLLDITHFSMAYVFLPAAALLIAAVLYWRWSRHSPVLKFAAAWFALTLLPVVGEFSWIQLHDRHLYLPSFGIALMVAVGLRRLAAWAGWPEHAPAIAAVILAVVAAVISARETRVWDNELSVFERAYSVAPGNPDAVTTLADAYAAAGAPDKAAATLQAAVQRYPKSVLLNSALARQFYSRGDYESARPYLMRVVSMGADNNIRSTALYELGMIEWKDGNRELAQQHVREAIRLAPHIDGYHRVLATMQRASAVKADRTNH